MTYIAPAPLDLSHQPAPMSKASDIKTPGNPLNDRNPPVPVSLNEDNNDTSRIPVVKLQVDIISDTLAARLASSLLAMVLFLKNQIPLPVQQLARISGKNSSAKAAKQRADLLNSFDTLSSHLTTTFAALSTALARTYDKDEKKKNYRVYLAILLGPSLGTSKSKVFLGVDHFEAKLWGTQAGENSHESEEEEDSGSNPESDVDDDESSEEGPSDSESESEDEESSASETEIHKEAPAQRAKRGPSIAPPPMMSYAEEQRFLQNAERLLSRTLAAADANGYGLASEMSPTQTHLLIRAPRNFTHPAWVPRQNVTHSLDTSLGGFLTESGREVGGLPVSTSKAAKKQKAEGVWLTATEGFVPDSKPVETSTSQEDDMIWWSWDGKLVGFVDW